MSLSKDVSNALDILGQGPGSVLVRGTDRWFALEPTEPGLFLRLNDDGIPEWIVGGSSNFTDTGWIPLPLEPGWGNWQGTPAYRQNGAGAVYLDGLLDPPSTTDGLLIATLPANMVPRQNIWKRLYTGLGIGQYSLFIGANGELKCYQQQEERISITTSFMPLAE